MNDQNSGIKWMLGLLGISIPSALLGVSIANRNYTLLLWGLLAFAIFIAIGFGIFLLWKRWQSNKESARFSTAFDQEASTAPRELSAAEERKRLDDLRKKFQEGVQEFKRRKLSLYQEPWFLMVGEPGSGKTYAIKKSTLDFVIEHEDEGVAGIAGTVNMNWWFTQSGIIIDTAGKLLFEGLRPGQSGQWREFLGLLKKYRPYAPINGLILVVPANSLISDDPATIEQKGKTIFSQLDLLQRTLDVRFPIFLLITKSDLIPGFREYFDDLKDPERQYQMLGWSNKEPLDTFVKASEATAHLREIAARLQRRRMSLLKDPSPEEPEARRIDEVDALFAFPNNLALLETNLRRYLEIIFRQGAWSLPPLFLRGIYFTSAIREGEALNDAVAAALGVDPTRLEGHLSMRRDTPLFLRDFFREKVFREKGLVTAASNVRAMLRKRSLLAYGAGFVVLLLLATLFVAGNYQLKTTIGEETAYWKRAAEQGWEQDGTWEPIVVREGTLYAYRGTNQLDGFDRGVTLSRFHRNLAEKVAQPVKLGIFAPLGGLGGIQNDRGDAQRILLGRSLIAPAIVQTRAKMTGQSFADLNDLQARAQQQNALIALIQLEAALQPGASEGAPLTTNLYGPWITYLTGQEFRALDTNLVAVIEGQRNYTIARSLSGGDTLAKNQAIANGVDLFLQSADESRQSISNRVERIKMLTLSLQNFQRVEDQLRSKAQGSALDPALLASLTEQTPGILQQVQVFATNKWGLSSNQFSLVQAYKELQTEANQSTNAFKALTEAAVANTGIFREIQDAVANAQKQMTDFVSSSLDQELLARLDERFLGYASDARTVKLAIRSGLYQRTAQALQSDPFANTLGTKWAPYKAFKQEMETLRAGYERYKGGFEAGLAEIGKAAEESLNNLLIGSFNRYSEAYRQFQNRIHSAEVLGAEDANSFTVDGVIDTYSTYHSGLKKYSEDINAAPEILPADFLQVTSLLREQGLKPTLEELNRKFVARLNDQIVLSFPLALPQAGRASLGAAELRALLAKAERTHQALSLATVPPGSAELASLNRKLQAVTNLVRFLVDDRGNAVNCSITPLVPTGPTRDYASSLWRSVRFNNGKWRSTESAALARDPAEQIAANEPLIIELCQLADTATQQCPPNQGIPPVTVKFDSWGGIGLLLQNASTAKRVSQHSYAVEVPVRASIEGAPLLKKLPLSITFDPSAPAPSLDQWPDLAKQ